MQEHGAQNPSRTIPWSILQRARKTQGFPLVSPTGLCTTSPIRATPLVTHMQEYCACATHVCSNRQNATFIFNAPSNSKKKEKLSNTKNYLTWHAKDMSITNNLIEAVWTTLVQAQGLHKPHQLAILSPINGTTLDTGQHSFTLGVDKLTTILLVKVTTPDIRQTPSTWESMDRE